MVRPGTLGPHLVDASIPRHERPLLGHHCWVGLAIGLNLAVWLWTGTGPGPHVVKGRRMRRLTDGG